MMRDDIEDRLAVLEREVAALKSRKHAAESPNRWVEQIAGTFSSPEACAAFDEAMRYGRQWREAQRPKARRKRKTAKK